MLLPLAGLLLPLAGEAQFTQAWVNRYSYGTGTVAGPAIAADASGNIYVTATVNQYSSAADFVTIKYSATGVQQWMAFYNGPAGNDDEAVAITTDASGNVYVTGSSRDGSNSDGSNMSFATIKYSSTGAQQWVARYEGGTIANAPSALKVDASGNVYVTGYSVTGSFGYDYGTVKYNSAGVQQWYAIYNGTAGDIDQATALAVDAAGNVYVTGESEGLNGGVTSYDYLTIKYSPAGATLWTARYNSPGNGFDNATGLVLDAAANVYVTGQSAGAGVTIGYNTSGIQEWVNINHAVAANSSIVLDPAGNVITTGYVEPSPGIFGFVTTKISGGVTAWSAEYYAGYGNGIVGPEVAVDNTSNIYITGPTATSPSATNYSTIKYTATGSEDWVATYNGPANAGDVPSAIVVVNPKGSLGRPPTGLPSIYVTGVGDIAASGYGDITTLEYTQQSVVGMAVTPVAVAGAAAVGDADASGALTAKLSNYPNPFRGVSTIAYTLPYDAHVSLKVYDQGGREIAVLLDGDQPAGNYTTPFNGSRLASGVYLYKLVAASPGGSFSQTKQMLLVP